MTLSLSSIRNSFPASLLGSETPPSNTMPTKNPEVGYIDTQLDGRLAPPVLKVHTPEAFDHIQQAAEALGLAALAGTLRDRKEEGFQPVDSDLANGDENARAEWNKGQYDPTVFHGQGAVAVRRVLEDGAEQHRNPDAYPWARMSSQLAARMFELDTTTTPRNNAKAPVDDEVAHLANITPQAAPALDKGKGWREESYEAFADTDPGHDT